MSGQTVVCKYFTCEKLLRLVWQDEGALIFAHSEDQYDSRIKGNLHLEAVGFQLEDVFEYDTMALGASDPWSLLIPYANAQRDHLDTLRNAQSHTKEEGETNKVSPSVTLDESRPCHGKTILFLNMCQVHNLRLVQRFANCLRRWRVRCFAVNSAPQAKRASGPKLLADASPAM